MSDQKEEDIFLSAENKRQPPSEKRRRGSRYQLCGVVYSYVQQHQQLSPMEQYCFSLRVAFLAKIIYRETIRSCESFLVYIARNSI